MKSKSLLTLLVTLAASVIMLSSFLPYPSGAPSPYNYSGSPNDGKDCSWCHGNASTVSGWITSNVPASGYVPGTVYQITATNSISGSGKYGFEVSPQNASGTLLGTLAAGSNSKLVGSGKWITQSSSSNSITSWTFNWTAPSAGTGSVTFYGSFARSTGSSVKNSTLVVSESTSGSIPAAAGPITGPGSVCLNSTQTYSVGNISGATSYVWSVPAGATILTGQGSTSISVNYGAAAISGNVSVYGTNTNGSGAASNLAVTVLVSPGASGTITGPASACQGSNQEYSVVNTAGVTYTWTVPSGWSIAAGQGSHIIGVVAGASSGNIEVVPLNACGNGTGSSIAVTASPLPLQPGEISGTNIPCEGSTQTYAVDNTAGITYTWTTPSGTVITSGQGTNSIQVTIGNSAGLISVVPSNSCGTGQSRTRLIEIRSIPVQPAFIEGSETPCIGNTVSYAVNNVSNVTFTWTVPTGSSIVSGQGTNSISVLIGSEAGLVSVTPSNDCGTGQAQSKNIVPTVAPTQPGPITGLAQVCQGWSQVYSVDNVSGNTYNWFVPNGAEIISGQGTNSITVVFGATGGAIEVVSENNCGTSPGQAKAVTVTPLPGYTAHVTGPSPVDPTLNPTSVYSTTGATAATSYDWSISPADAGSIAGTGLNGTVTWNSTFSGVAIIKAKGTNECGEGDWSDPKEVVVLDNTGIKESNPMHASIYPSPNDGNFYISLNANSDKVSARIMDLSGKEYYSCILSGKGETLLSPGIPAGSYVIILDNGTAITKLRMVIQ
ncbi:MAG: T9SS type A sorting domain-containing protein [Bacteroidales bacterium]|nr:T9SS type A sorting domain-containing protein [Bacteroidales bacterium]